MSEGLLIVVIILSIIIFVGLNSLIASNASDIAQNKGYEKKKWFHMCFWLGPISYIIVAAMPDLTMREKLDQTNVLLKEIIDLNTKLQMEKEDNNNKEVANSIPILPNL